MLVLVLLQVLVLVWFWAVACRLVDRNTRLRGELEATQILYRALYDATQPTNQASVTIQ